MIKDSFFVKRFLIFLIVFSNSTIFSFDSKASTYSVTSTQDSGPGTLRTAISSANGSSGLDTIVFNLNTSSGPATIIQLYEYSITDDLFINGFSQAGSSPSNILVHLQGNSFSTILERAGFKIAAKVAQISGIKFKNYFEFTWNSEPSAGMVSAIRIFPSGIFPAVRRINISNNEFESCNRGVYLLPKTQNHYDSINGIEIINNSFNNLLMAIETQINYSHYVRGLNNWIIDSNMIQNSFNGIRIDIGNLFYAVDSLSIRIAGNDISLFNSLSIQTSGIDITHPNGYDLGFIPNILIEDNILNNCVFGIRLDGSYYSTGINNIGRILINRNIIYGKGINKFSQGIVFRRTDGFQFTIMNNKIDSCSVAIESNSAFAVDSSFLTSVILDSNILKTNGTAIIFNASGVNDYEQVKNVSIINNNLKSNWNDGIRFHLGGTGSYFYDFDTLLIYNNTIRQCGNHGISIVIDGTGNSEVYISNLIVDSNRIFANDISGIELRLGGTGNSFGKIEKALFARNMITQNGEEGIELRTSNISPRPYIYESVSIIDNKIATNDQNGIKLFNHSSDDSVLFRNFNIKQNKLYSNDISAIWVESNASDYNSLVNLYKNLKISENSIYNNVQKGITHHHYGVSNTLISPPTINTATFLNNQIDISYNYSGLANKTYLVEFFLTDTMLPTKEQGKLFIGSDTIITNQFGNAIGTISFSFNSNYRKLTATAKELSFGPTSEFSSLKQVVNSIQEPENNELRIYPNPAESKVNVDCNKQIFRIIVSNNLGQVLKVIEAKDFKMEIDISDLKAGMYQMSVITKNGRRTEKFQVK